MHHADVGRRRRQPLPARRHRRLARRHSPRWRTPHVRSVGSRWCGDRAGARPRWRLGETSAGTASCAPNPPARALGDPRGVARSQQRSAAVGRHACCWRAADWDAPVACTAIFCDAVTVRGARAPGGAGGAAGKRVGLPLPRRPREPRLRASTRRHARPRRGLHRHAAAAAAAARRLPRLLLHAAAPPSRIGGDVRRGSPARRPRRSLPGAVLLRAPS